jgi:hypothetical protein
MPPRAKSAPLGIWTCVLAGLAALVAAERAAAVSTDDITAVMSRTSNDYVRARLADGSYQQESYAFGPGGRWAGAVSDASVDRLKFMDVAKMISHPLADQGYLPAQDPKSAKLIIMVYWGRTSTPMREEDSSATEHLANSSNRVAEAKANIQQQDVASESLRSVDGPSMVCGHIDANVTVSQVDDQIEADSQMTGALSLVAAQERMRDQMDAKNAALIGFGDLWNQVADYRGTAREFRRQEVADELEESRYFVVLMAYDFQAMWKDKKHKLLWETRFSIRQRHHEFDKVLTSMSRYASNYFGQDSRGIVRMAIPEGRVNVGELKDLGAVAER